MRENMGFVLTFIAMMIAVAVLQGCAGAVESKSGSLWCVGACQLILDESSIEVDEDVIIKETHGLGA